MFGNATVTGYHGTASRSAGVEVHIEHAKRGDLAIVLVALDGSTSTEDVPTR